MEIFGSVLQGFRQQDKHKQTAPLGATKSIKVNNQYSERLGSIAVLAFLQSRLVSFLFLLVPMVFFFTAHESYTLPRTLTKRFMTLFVKKLFLTMTRMQQRRLSPMGIEHVRQ